MREIIIKPDDDSPNVTKYIERFGHLPAIEARKWMKHEELERIAGEALKRNKPIKEWEEREHIKLDSVLDEMYDTPVSDLVDEIVSNLPDESEN